MEILSKFCNRPFDVTKLIIGGWKGWNEIGGRGLKNFLKINKRREKLFGIREYSKFGLALIVNQRKENSNGIKVPLYHSPVRKTVQGKLAFNCIYDITCS